MNLNFTLSLSFDVPEAEQKEAAAKVARYIINQSDAIITALVSDPEMPMLSTAKLNVGADVYIDPIEATKDNDVVVVVPESLTNSTVN